MLSLPPFPPLSFRLNKHPRRWLLLQYCYHLYIPVYMECYAIARLLETLHLKLGCHEDNEMEQHAECFGSNHVQHMPKPEVQQLGQKHPKRLAPQWG
jgi:hypothetical protein